MQAAAPSITAPDSDGHVGLYSSLALDAMGFPVVSYWDLGRNKLRVLHCNDPMCSGDDESVVVPLAFMSGGQYTSLALDAAGNPVISFNDEGKGGLGVLHCGDPNCTGAGATTGNPGTMTTVALDTTLALDAAGNPVIAYGDTLAGTLRVLHCNDPACAGGDEQPFAPDINPDVGAYASLVLDAEGYPVVSYYDGGQEALRLLHCDTADCRSQRPVETPTPTPPAAGTELFLPVIWGG